MKKEKQIELGLNDDQAKWVDEISQNILTNTEKYLIFEGVKAHVLTFSNPLLPPKEFLAKYKLLPNNPKITSGEARVNIYHNSKLVHYKGTIFRDIEFDIFPDIPSGGNYYDYSTLAFDH